MKVHITPREGAILGVVHLASLGCALGPFEASALMATSPRKEERKKGPASLKSTGSIGSSVRKIG